MTQKEFDKWIMNDVKNEKYTWLISTDLLHDLCKEYVNKNLPVIHSCEKLKEKEVQSFGDWLEENNYTSENDYIFKAGKFYGFKTLYRKYKREIS